MRNESWEYFGAHVTKVAPGFEQTVFRLYAPGAVEVRLMLTKQGESETLPIRPVPASSALSAEEEHLMERSREGFPDVFELILDGNLTGVRYHFRIRGRDGKELKRSDPYGAYFPDPAGLDAEVLANRNIDVNSNSAVNSFGVLKSLNEDVPLFETEKDGCCKNGSFASRSLREKYLPGYDEPMLIYEVHPGSWKRHEDGSLYTYEDLAGELVPYVKDLGFTAIELMGIAEYPADSSWGYQVRGYYAPTSRYGRPSGFRHLVEAAHEAGLMVILDWVGAHFSTDPNGLSLFCGEPFFERTDSKGQPLSTCWGSAPFDYSRPFVRDFLIQNALFWERVYHVDALRVDAVSVMLYGDPVSRGEMSLPEMQEFWARKAQNRALGGTCGAYDSYGSYVHGSKHFSYAYGFDRSSYASDSFGFIGSYPVSGSFAAGENKTTDMNSDISEKETSPEQKPKMSSSVPELDESAVSFLRQLTETVRREGNGMILMAEESTAYPGVTKPVEAGGLGFDYKWDLGWMHDTLSYYSASSDDKKSEECHRQMTFPMMYRDTEQFLLPLSHDEVVYGKRSLLSKAPYGEETVRFAALKTYMGYWMAHPGKKLLFMGQEFGDEKEWDYQSALDFRLLPDGTYGDALRRDYDSFFRDLVKLYRSSPVLWRYENVANGSAFDHFKWLRSDDHEHGLFAFARFAKGERSLVWIFHFREDSCSFNLPVPEEGVYRKALDAGGAFDKNGVMHLTGRDDLGRPCLSLVVTGVGLVVYEWNCE